MRPRDDPGGAPGGDPGPRRTGGGDLDLDGVRAADVIARGVHGAEPGEVPGRLCEVAVELLPVIGASVSLRSQGMPVQLSASSPHAAHLSEIQATLGDGPCQSALEEGAPVLARDLTTGRDAGRWPVFAQQATAAGVRAVYAVPLGSDAVYVGTLDLYRDRPGGLTDRQLHVARLVAGVMTVALMALPREDEPGAQDGQPWLSGLAAEHDEVYQAVGMIMAQLGVGADDALARLRGDAFARGRTALDVAREVIAHRRHFDRD
ncbi:GAF and ANTAR domain-containing protein [Streptomyces lomondensis]|uniref:GAF domain-containing protein n=1 Tax=Streptomyces lomondensis TaxID=68229 RepID=A0ABQ2XI74_9ACTN|nr:GAF and ANTAR domain-containing protein [Streptomyces lomondensis]MCF0077501.1 GAF and ANTAR domain-containing protein [Streptomyces lomondensis]GGX17709.1 GAF domain-containing protein [Streptomyces lomondensis]